MNDAATVASTSTDYSSDSAVETRAIGGGVDTSISGMVENSPTDSFATRLGLGDLTDEDLLSIARCARGLSYHQNPAGILDDVANNWKACFRLDPGLMILEIVNRGQDKELFVFWLEGKNMFRQLRKIKRVVLALAKANNCNRLGASVEDYRFAKFLLKSFNGQLVGYNVAVEI